MGVLNKEQTVPNNEVQLWRRGAERTRSADKLDPTYVETQRVLTESKKYGQMTQRRDGSYSNVVRFRSPTEEDKYRDLHAEAHLSKKDDSIRIAIAEGFDQNGKPIKLRTFQMSPQGVVIDLDTMHDIDAVTGVDDLENIANGLKAVRKHELLQIKEKRDRTHRIRKGFATTAIGLVVTGVAAVGVYAGVKTWVIDPAEQENVYREEFNESDYILPGEGIEFDYHDFETVPVSEFEDIPTYGGIDTDLSSPRTFQLDTDGCVSVTTKVASTGDLFVALPEDSPYIGYHFETSLEDNGFSVCLTEDNPLEDNADTVEVAIQVR